MRFIALKELDKTEGTVQLREGNVCAFTFLTNYAIGGLAPAFPTLSQEFNKTPGETANLLLWPILVLGVFNFFWVPLANYFGKRPVFVIASRILYVSYIWGACAKSFRSLLWSNIIAAFAGSSTEALGAAMVNDLYFLHERGFFMGIYMNSISGGNTIGPLICGFVVESIGWRWHKWMAVIFTAINFLAVLFFVPETRFDRGSEFAASPESLSLRPEDDIPAQKMATVILAWVVAINIWNTFVLQAPPYSWKPSINGLINIPGLLGNLAGSFTGGWMVDKYSDWRARKSHGVFQPETRLFMLIIPGFIVPVGCILFGYGVERTLNWTLLFFGYAFVALGLTAVPTIGMAYVSDSYLPVSSDALLLVNGLKNIVAFGFLYGVVPWVTKEGYVNVFGTQAGVFVAILALAIPLAFYGARLRHRTAQWRIVLRN
ncbi:MFS general substrate transporter [Tothia fuscella]|uniref:MFS general substrate transporter n=1 Tax=Tothia fuscella TaxID=1048955 RepID=A0A9P4U4Z8_9PEZI|nr:MFS general substrate transporter [Tothia fuscella]